MFCGDNRPHFVTAERDDYVVLTLRREEIGATP